MSNAPALLGSPPPTDLRDARNQLHWAAQVIASVGYTLVEPVPDWSHTTLVWNDTLGALLSQPTPAPASFRAALRLSDLTLLLLDDTNTIQNQFNLAGHTLDEGYQWLTNAIGNLTGNTPTLVRPDTEVPPHPVAAGAAFSLDDPDSFAELSRWFANANFVLQSLLTSVSEAAAAVLVWPHHFDIAVLFTFPPEANVESSRSIGIGLVPGDETYPEPYWYIVPHPVSPKSDLPTLDGEGIWHTEGWLGAVLIGSNIVSAGGTEAQAARVHAFIWSGIAASRSLLDLPV